MIWSGIGTNYGHQSAYDTAQVENDFTYLRSSGLTRVRIVMPNFDGSMINPQDMVVRALNHGFYVVWGACTGRAVGALTATIWASCKNFILNTIVPWAQTNGLHELCLGNESELQADGTTLTTATIRSDIRSMATSIKSGGFTGKLSYSTSALSTYMTPWASEGTGDLDLIGFNSYDTFSNFSNRNSTITSSFGNKGYVSEFGSVGGGYPDFNDENAFYNDTNIRIQSMKNAGIQSGYFFCYRDGGYGVPANSFALVETDGTVHLARNVVLGQ